MYEAKMWHDDKKFCTPMITLDSSEHLFVGDFVKIKGYDIYGKVEKFVTIILLLFSQNYKTLQKI